jgi:LuxR family maltose regulon positive regulatory protein
MHWLFWIWLRSITSGNEQLKRATAISQRSQNDEFFVGCRLLDVRLQLALANIAGAEEILEQALALVRAGKVPEPITERVYATQAYLLMEKGESASALGQKLVDNADGNNFYRYIGITKARTLPDKQARAYLEKFSQLAQANEWGYGLISIRALQATLAETQAEGLDYLKEALQLAEADGFIRTFVDSGKKLIPLLNQLKKRGVRPDYVTRILAAMPGKTDHVEQRQVTMLEPLSEREIEVLRLITLGMSNREIADELVISTGTAKSHVHNLCGKLGVSSRTEAAVKAKDLGLV